MTRLRVEGTPMATREPLTADVEDDPRDEFSTTALERRFADPGVPLTVTDIAIAEERGLRIQAARVVALTTARLNALQITEPDDWTLFATREGRITGYLSDAGCQRARDVIGVNIYNVSTPQKLVAEDGKSFMYVVRGDARSTLTGQVIEGIEGGRSSTEDFCKGLTGSELDLKVRKASRANLNGSCARELMGLKSVPISELQRAWAGTAKSTDHCSKGRGFGSAEERLGATRATEPDVTPPTCTACQPVNGRPVVLKYRPAKGNRGAFYGCPNWEKHPQQRIFVDAEAWVQRQQQAAAPKTEPDPETRAHSSRDPGANHAGPVVAGGTGQPAPPADPAPDLTDADIPFGGGRGE